MPVASNGTVISAEMGGIQYKEAEQAQRCGEPSAYLLGALSTADTKHHRRAAAAAAASYYDKE